MPKLRAPCAGKADGRKVLEEASECRKGDNTKEAETRQTPPSIPHTGLCPSKGGQPPRAPRAVKVEESAVPKSDDPGWPPKDKRSVLKVVNRSCPSHPQSSFRWCDSVAPNTPCTLLGHGEPTKRSQGHGCGRGRKRPSLGGGG